MNEPSPFFPDLLARFMHTQDKPECWITVEEFRDLFDLDKSFSPALSGFFRRLYNSPSIPGPYTVVRIETVAAPEMTGRTIRRYLVRVRPVKRDRHSHEDTEVSALPATATVKSRQRGII
ncbi:MAG: hypothetical protein PHD55_11175 [Methanoregula sp.]|jgi:hypothetical protein|nr:hypothetical protein [Methanoregula sp.]